MGSRKAGTADGRRWVAIGLNRFDRATRSHNGDRTPGTLVTFGRTALKGGRLTPQISKADLTINTVDRNGVGYGHAVEEVSRNGNAAEALIPRNNVENIVGLG